MSGQSGSGVAIIAGCGAFPFEIAHALRVTGATPFIIGLRGFVSRDAALQSLPHAIIDMLDPQKIISTLRANKIEHVILAGSVSRPGPLALLSIYTFFRNREELRRIVSGGDDRILRGVIRLLEENGFDVIGVDQAAPDLLAPNGLIASTSLPGQAASDIALGLACLRDMGRYDLGQGVVVAEGRVLAMEGPEGTDAMLERVRLMQKNRRVILENACAILVKAPKPAQDRRVDLPAIGPGTIKSAKAAGLKGIAVAAHEVVLVERQKLIRDADQAGLFVTGVARS